ncbi:metallophosphoesterase [Fonticella tunisiensis]|uniref:DNA repair exonuclease SbcCD nuclease subunit n=1 Tax=Fonticella tunisiensis TaxID=1096341 RepID=A0A4R7KRW1_9CLOT|nr:metallophosphoesterase [Fonticella tunisiensis]TDT61547.1 DNA repair exonuclease SbcCD nuclease subunit [Fonticella tunisiensis]
MIKLLYFTDTHIRGNNPKSRKDNFTESLKRKFGEIAKVCSEESIDYVLFGGDLFDRPDVSLSIVKDFLGVLKTMPLPIYAVLGNHDVYGQNPDTVNRTIIGLLDTLGIIKLIYRGEKIYLKKEGITLQLTGCSYYYDIDVSESRQGYITDKRDCDYSIHMAHGFLMDKPFIQGIPYTLIDDIVNKTQADITLCGHYHTGFGIKKMDGKYFINPGAIARISNTISEVERIPSYLIIELGNEIKLTIKELICARPGDEVLDRDILRREEFRQQTLNRFIQQVNSYGDFEELNLQRIINEIALRENIPKEIKDEALRRISESQRILSSREVLK